MPETKDDIREKYPLPVYNYKVSIMPYYGVAELLTYIPAKATEFSFSEVSGLAIEFEYIEYDHGMSFFTGANIIRGRGTPVELTLKRGISRHGDELYTWLTAPDGVLKGVSDMISPTSVGLLGRKRNLTIDLCDDKGEALVRWMVIGAMPIKLTMPDFDATNNDIAIEEMQLVAHDLSVEYLKKPTSGLPAFVPASVQQAFFGEDKF